MNAELQSWLDNWLVGRPHAVHRAANKYPPGTEFNIHGRSMFVIGFTDDGSVILTPIAPWMDYEAALAARQPVCKCCQEKLDQLKS